MTELMIVLALTGVSFGSAALAAATTWAATRPKTGRLMKQVAELEAEVASLSPFRDVRDVAFEVERRRGAADAEIAQALAMARQRATAIEAAASAEAERLRRDAAAVLEAGRTEGERAREAAKSRAQVMTDQAVRTLREANDRAAAVIAEAEKRAQTIAGDALEAMREADRWTRTVKAMKNIVEGYGDQYMVATHSYLDELASDFGFAEAGVKLKLAREHSRRLVREGRAATCEYVEAHRRDTATRFVVDAFNGKVDSILTEVKTDNIGTLTQQISDAARLVNHNGTAFKNAGVTKEYVAARLDELKWAVLTIALRDRAREEQRLAKEALREEEKARREHEKAIRDAQKEEDGLRKAIERAEAQVAKANDEQRAKFEQQLAELSARLVEAEARNQRAVSMAQLTRSGHVYVISNLGSFGEGVYKVGMTRRLEPLDRIRELGDASVPFAFDVHAMIYSEDAPGLERDLHRALVTAQVNKTNPRKEFFRTGIGAIKDLVDVRAPQSVWTLAAAAAEYRETLALEAAIAKDPAVREAWLRGQYAWDPAEDLAEEDAGLGPASPSTVTGGLEIGA